MHSVFGRWQGARGVAAAVLGLVMVIGVLGATARGQTPTPDATLRAYRVAEKYVRAWEIPAADAPAVPDGPKAVGACVTLKLGGKVVGRGQAWSGVLAGPDAPTATVLRRAIRAAMQQAEPEMGVPNDAMRDAAIKLVAPDVLISVELAGPLSVVEFDTWDDAELTLRPGLDGVAVRVEPSGGKAAGTLHALFPGQMMLSNMLPHRGMGAMAAIAMGEGGAAAALDDPRKLREKSGLRMYRFRVGQVASTVGAGSPSLLYRGGTLRASVPSRAELEACAAMLVDHLVRRLNPIGEPSETRIAATIRPGSDSERNDAAPLEQLVAAYAVVKYLEHRGEDGIQIADAQNGPARFVQAAHYAGRSGEPATPALYYLAGQTICDPHKSVALVRVRSRAAVEAAAFGRTHDGSIPPLDDPYFKAVDPTMLPAALRPMVVMAASGLEDAPGTGYAKKADAILRDLYKGVSDSQLPGYMPWLGWAEIARTRLAVLENEPNDIPAAIALRHMRDECWKHQLSITDAGEDAMDMAGGIVFTGGVAGGRGNPYPTWQCVRPLAFMATMLRDPRLTEPNERSREIVRLMQAARFLRQLQVDESSAWMYPDPKLAIGGIRASTWDNSLPVDATSMTLLFTVELIKSLDELSAAKAAEQGSPVAPVVPAK